MTRASRSADRSAWRGASAALARAARRAREIAAQSGTPLVIYENGKIVHERVASPGTMPSSPARKPRRPKK